MNNDKVNLLLPKNSKLIIKEKSKKATSLRIKKISSKKQFKVQVLNGKEKIEEKYLTNMSIRIKSGKDFIILELLNKQEVMIHIHGSKILEDTQIKEYISTLII